VKIGEGHRRGLEEEVGGAVGTGSRAASEYEADGEAEGGQPSK
jgi:hypothetical protein